MAAIDLIVLGMIKQRPQSAYDLQKSVEYRNISRWVKISTPSIYKKVVQMEDKGYIKGNVMKDGKMPEKSVYMITPGGDAYFEKLMEKTAMQSVSIFLDFNAVIMNLDFAAPAKREELLEHIREGISDLKEVIGENSQKRTHIPMTGQTILEQQYLMASSMEAWILKFMREYLDKDADGEKNLENE